MTAEEIWKDLVAGNQRFRTWQPQPRDLVGERKGGKLSVIPAYYHLDTGRVERL
jgi:hypothetical protein